MKKLLVFMLLLVGGFTGEAWAVNVKYYIVNKSGLTPVYEIRSHNEGEALQIPNELKSPYIQEGGYKYFSTVNAAQAYTLDKENITDEVTTYSSGLTEVYVGYHYDPTYTPEGLPVLETAMSDNAIRYHIYFPAIDYYMYVEGANSQNHKNTKVTNTGDHTSMDEHFSFISDNCDPYDIKIVTPYHPKGWMYGPTDHGSATLNNDRFHMEEHTPTYKIESFFFAETNNKLAICAVTEPYQNNENDIQLTYLARASNGIRMNNVASIGDNQQILIKPLSIFHLVDADGNILISAYSNQLDLAHVPAGLGSRVIPNEQYRYFSTNADAAAYTKSQVINNPLTKATPNKDVYVGYHYVNNPQIIDLSGTRWYYIRQNHINAPSDNTYFYSVRDKDVTGNNNIYVYTKEQIEEKNNSTGDSYTAPANAMFRFEGNDPYKVIVRNGYRYQNDNNPYSFIKISNKETWSYYVYTDRTEYTPLMLLNYGTYEDDYYTLAALNPSYTPYEKYIGTQNYLLSWYSSGSGGSQVLVANNDFDKIWYYSNRNYPKLSFEPVQHKTTFHIIDKEGREAISYKGLVDADMPLNLAENRYARIPEAIRSPYIEKENITFYGKATPIGTAADGRRIYELSEPMERTPLLYGTDIYVTYTTDHLADYTLPLAGETIDFNMLAGGDNYVYVEDDAVCGNAQGTDEDKLKDGYIWQLLGGDPYAIQLHNLDGDKLLTYDSENLDATLTVSDGSNTTGTYFILLNGTDGGADAAKFEIMAATGHDAAEEHYNIGYDDGSVKLFKSKEAGANEIQVRMTPVVFSTYHIVDKQGSVVLSYRAGAEDNGFKLQVPESLVSPFVTQYYYWEERTAQTPLTSVGSHQNIYVTYDVNEMLSTLTEIVTSDRTKYRLKFMDETNTPRYPHVGEGGELVISDNSPFEEETKHSAITRPNWGWYFESNTKDPYHVKIVSAAQYEKKLGERFYLHSELKDAELETTIGEGTEYMLLGNSLSACQLVTLIDNGQHTVKSLGTTSIDRGEFEIEELILQPTLILLDRHGWELMRKPLPAPEGLTDVTPYDADAINAYNSPMVKTYKFYRGGEKLIGYHKFEVKEANRIAEAASLTGLSNTVYAMGDNIYVTYDVKEEYEASYNAAEGKNAYEYLLHVGDSYLQVNGSGNIAAIDGETARKIESGDFTSFGDASLNNMLWYVKPNPDIDNEMGYEGEAITYDDSRKGFDPYNLQIQNSGKNDKNITDANGKVTFMAVQDANGNMRLMPRFDHDLRLQWSGSTLSYAAPADAAPANDRTGMQTVMLHRLVRYTYIIIDNSGREALRYHGLVGEEVPQVLPQFQSPMAKDFKFYIGLETQSRAVDDIVYNLTNIDDKEITGSFVAAGLYNDNEPIYVRYAYDEAGDTHKLLSQGDWHTVQVGGKNIEDGNKVADGSEVDDSWLFKYIRNVTTGTPDPYNITIFNREHGDSTDGEESHYAFLSHGTDGLALLLTRSNDAFRYEFLSLDETDNVIQNEEISDYATKGFSDDDSKITFDKVEYKFIAPKYVIIANDGVKALTVESEHKDAIEQASLPNGTRSPLLNDEDYIYYADAANDAETQTYTVSDQDRIETLCGLPKANIVYVRYNYNPDTSPLKAADLYQSDPKSERAVKYAPVDITGAEWYNITSTDGSTDNWWYDNNGNLNTTVIDDQLSDGIYQRQGTKEYLFKLTGGDPYAIRIYNSAKGDGYQVDLATNGKPQFSPAAADLPTFMLLKEDKNSYLSVTGKYKDYGSADAAIKNLTFYQAPTARYYTFHGVRYQDGAPIATDDSGNPQVTWTAKLRRNWFMPIRLEDDIVRLFTLYEKEDATDDFAACDEVGDGRFYADAALSEPVIAEDGETKMENAYPAIEEGEDFHIYFKYQVDADELKEMTSTLEEVKADVEAYLSDGPTGGKLRQGKIKAKWSFMVLDTDEGITTNVDEYGKRTPVGQQYFLYRRDDGKVGWMDNDYALHKDETDNYNCWTYHRLAEWHRQGENHAFREGRWLWTFIGDDPYNIRLLNMESAVGVRPESRGVYSLPQGEECYTIATEEVDSHGNKTYPVSIPTEKPDSSYTWGLCPGYGTEKTFSLQLPMTDSLCHALYWKMAIGEKKADSVVPDSVVGTVKQYDRSNAIRLLKYEPLMYEDVNLTIRRIDEVTAYKDAKDDEKSGILANMKTGISKLYFAESERMFVADDVIDTSKPETLPINVRRAFCKYTLYDGIFTSTEDGIYTVTAGPYPDYNKPKVENNDTLRDDNGRIIYEYYDKEGNYVPDGAQSIYASYEVTRSDIFFMETAPTQEEVKKMVNNNDRVYFMDFPSTYSKEGLAYNTGYHGYFDENATYRDQVEGGGIEDETIRGMFKTAKSRMQTAPDNLKWYFVGDPYKVQVYCVAGEWGSNNDEKEPQTVAANLCRFDETETKYQFVVDCVHLRVPDYSKKDDRQYKDVYDENGRPTGEKVYNRGYGHPIFDDFFWEMVPAANDVEGDFALRFKEDNDLLGYRNVYYYLGHDGITEQYHHSEDEKNKDYNIDLSYSSGNEQRQDGDYKGYHMANNSKTTIRLTQPVKVYVSAKNEKGEQITTDELSEYYGYGETLTEIPRHLQRKYVTYTPTVNMPWKLDEGGTDHVFRLETYYKLDDIGNHIFTPKDPTDNATDSEKGMVKWLDVAVNNYWLYYDKTGDDLAKLSYTVVNPDDSVKALKGLHWAFIGDPYDFTIMNRRQYADKQMAAGKASDKAYNLYMVGTKRKIDNYKAANDNDSVIWTTSLRSTDEMTKVDSETTAAENTIINTHWALQMWKTGGKDDFFLRTTSLKQGNDDHINGSQNTSTGINQTNNYWRMVAKPYQYVEGYEDEQKECVSFFNLVPYSLSDRDRYESKEASDDYSKTMGGLGATQQKIEIRTVSAKDNDGAANDCFDAVVRVVSEDGVERLKRHGLEISYGNAAAMLPQTLRRYGCDYECYVNYKNAASPGNIVAEFDEKFKQHQLKEYENIEQGDPITLTYVYHVADSVNQFFTSSEDALIDEFVWLLAYFQWLQHYSGTNVEVEKTRWVFDHYVYNAEGLIIDEVYREEKYIEVVPNASEDVLSSSYLNTHGQQNGIYSDESTATDEDRLKWGFVGDPYDFTMKNYAKYLENPNAGLFVDEKGNVMSSNTASTHLTIIVDENGKPYLAIVDEDGNFLELITFDYTSTSDKSLHTASGSGIDGSDPTGNSINNKNVKEFWPTGLTKYANLVVYHLVMAHQNSLEHVHKGNDKLTQVPVEEETPGGEDSDLTDDDKKNVDTRLHEFLKYWGLHIAKDSTHYFNINGNEDKTMLVKSLLKKNGTLRNFIHYPIEDAEVKSVGIGTRPLVPWYMKRQFCTYTMYQRDVQEAVPGDMIEADDEWEGETTEFGDKRYKVGPDGEVMRKVRWVSIFDKSEWEDKEQPSLLAEAEALQGKPLTRLADCHRNRKVDVAVLYEVNPEQFRFSTSGRNTTAWYQMMNAGGEDDVLMNFSYRDGIGSQTDRTQHYTNDYLWAPHGDPYGFVLRSRYATINGTGWDDVVVTTTGKLPKGKDEDGNLIYKDSQGNNSVEYVAPESDGLHVTYTGSASSDSQVKFDDKRIVHWREGDVIDDDDNDKTIADTDGASNAIYEMFPGNTAYTNAFIMHPTSAWLDTNDQNMQSFYMVANPDKDETVNIELKYSTMTDLKTNPYANWQMMATAEQLLPYFDRAGYVGGLDPAKAQNFSNMDIRSQLRQHADKKTHPDFTLLSQAQKVVYDGAFYDNTGKIVEEGSDRPEASLLPMTFKSTNLINMAPGYYRIKAFSEEALSKDEKMNGGLTGPRYISGYRFESEKGTDVAQSDQSDQSTPLAPLNLHFFETSMDKATVRTFGELSTAPNDHKAMQRGSNIELLPADFDPSSIFYFDKEDTRYYTMGTQGLTVYAKPGDGTQMRDADPTDDDPTLKKEFRVVDVGGTAITIRIDETTGDNWDDVVAKNLQTNYFDLDGYNIICKKDNEMNETPSGVQTTKWLLQPVGIKEDWPYNEMPLRVEVQKGGVIRNTEEPDPYYYATLYVPFDTRLGSTIDGAFTVTTTVQDGANLTMPSVSQFNGIGNPQYVPAKWPVVLRTSKPQKWTIDGNSRNYVNMYLPYTSPQDIEYTGKLHGSYLEKVLTTEDFQKEDITVDNPTIMVFGVPFEEKSHNYSEDKSFGLYTNDNWCREEYPGFTARTASDKERNNKYVYHNKVYYILNEAYKEHDASNGSRFIVTIFDGDDDGKDEAPDFFGTDPSTPWPCDVFDLQGRRVAENETPETLRKNHPGLPKGVYVFGGRKVVIR